MALVRILVDGYSLLHRCRFIAKGKPRHAAEAREALIALLTRYRDVVETPITVVFDGGKASPSQEQPDSTREMEILYSRDGETADDLIERVTGRLVAYGEVMAVTDDYAERNTVLSLGGSAASCKQFMEEVTAKLDEFDGRIRDYNRLERRRFSGSN